MQLDKKLAILTRAARYDVSCASSGSGGRQGGKPSWSNAGQGLGAAAPAGVCHSFTPDGRCISLFKVLLTNRCVYSCKYCVNNTQSDTPRAEFGVRELVDLTLEFYKRNYIEGLFLSSGVFPTPDATMERLVRVVRSMREKYSFGGYIHLKVIPGADPVLVDEAARWVDRVSANIELPTQAGLALLAPDKDGGAIRGAMHRIKRAIDAKGERGVRPAAPGGQSTQMVVGADATPDRTILRSAAALYGSYKLKRVYYSAFTPVAGAKGVPSAPVPLVREHRLYQADWLLRFYGFGVEEIVTRVDGLLDPELDPKTVWALVHRERFPVDVNTADREMLLRVPGLGLRSVARIVAARRSHKLRVEDLAKLRTPLKRVLPFVELADHVPQSLDRADLRARLVPGPKQLSLWEGACAPSA